ncbi:MULTISPECIES: PDZ domain-containing protein [Shouchella]|uniref:PDZ domain-containing protein n=2 Tax=Shouchella TaxID=2893057 RepID=A0ABY7W650_9BACI|nr:MULTISPECIES: PDZ domain-containing protein [Shouchella]MED4129050.1 PDZ domain-containing protein [Shouchella miscanthi]WDF04432.1 PDZ domain-containing protein [Shouchella hunanensis]
MVETILIAVASFFLNPIVYIGFFTLFIIAHWRVKQERSSFHTRVYARRADFLLSAIPSVVTGVLVSIVTIAAGVVVPTDILVAIALATLLLLLTGQMHWLTPTYVFFLVALYLVVFPQFMVFPFSESGDQGSLLYAAITFSVAVLLFSQAMLVTMNGKRLISPQLEKGKRGRFIGIHKINRLWIVPVVFFIPESALVLPWPWPTFSIGSEFIQPILFPILLGFKQQSRTHLDTRFYQYTRAYFLLAGVATVSTVILFYYPNEWLFVSILGVIAFIHAISQFIIRHKEKKDTAFFTEEEESCRVVGVLPNSPADKMKIVLGEEISKVNGQMVYDETTLYQALQKNPVYCKIEVKDVNGEKRFVQGPLYSGEHYQLGVLLVRKQEKLSNSII